MCIRPTIYNITLLIYFLYILFSFIYINRWLTLDLKKYKTSFQYLNMAPWVKHSLLHLISQLILLVPMQQHLFKIALEKTCYLIKPKRPYVIWVLMLSEISLPLSSKANNNYPLLNHPKPYHQPGLQSLCKILSKLQLYNNLMFQLKWHYHNFGKFKWTGMYLNILLILQDSKSMLSYKVVVMHMFKIVLLTLCLIFLHSLKETYLMQLKELLPSTVTPWCPLSYIQLKSPIAKWKNTRIYCQAEIFSPGLWIYLPWLQLWLTINQYLWSVYLRSLQWHSPNRYLS